MDFNVGLLMSRGRATRCGLTPFPTQVDTRNQLRRVISWNRHLDDGLLPASSFAVDGSLVLFEMISSSRKKASFAQCYIFNVQMVFAVADG